VEHDYRWLAFTLTAAARRWKCLPIRIHSDSWLEKHVLDGICVVDVDRSGNMASGVLVLEATVDDMISAHAVVKVAVKQISQLLEKQESDSRRTELT
jgi:hypothetical protein